MYGTSAFLTNGKRYLSTDFKLHISNETPCADHCSVYALSTDEAEYRGTCSHQHNIGCDRCSDLRDAILDIQVALSHLQLRYYILILDCSCDVSRRYFIFVQLKVRALTSIH